MGKQDDDIAQLKNATAKTVTVQSFYMDETEITNSEYRQICSLGQRFYCISYVGKKI